MREPHHPYDMTNDYQIWQNYRLFDFQRASPYFAPQAQGCITSVACNYGIDYNHVMSFYCYYDNGYTYCVSVSDFERAYYASSQNEHFKEDMTRRVKNLEEVYLGGGHAVGQSGSTTVQTPMSFSRKLTKLAGHRNFKKRLAVSRA